MSCPLDLTIASLIATSLASVELFAFNFCLHDEVYVPPLPMVVNMPM